MKVSKYQSMKILKYRHIVKLLAKYQNIKISKYQHIGKYKNTKVSKYQNIQISKAAFWSTDEGRLRVDFGGFRSSLEYRF